VPDALVGQEVCMTSADWTASTDPHAMLAFLRDRGVASDRKYRLFAAHCCRRIWELLPEPSRAAVEVAERATDGRASADEWAAARSAAADAVVAATEARNRDPATPEVGILAARAASTAVGLPGRAGPDSAQAAVAACSLAARDPTCGPGQGVLAGAGFGVVVDLRRAGLADVHEGLQGLVSDLDLARDRPRATRGHGAPPAAPAVPADGRTAG
jgi:hypothetical protein